MIAQPWLEPHELERSCALDIAEGLDEITQEEAAHLTGLHRTDTAKLEAEFLAIMKEICK